MAAGSAELRDNLRSLHGVRPGLRLWRDVGCGGRADAEGAAFDATFQLARSSGARRCRAGFSTLRASAFGLGLFTHGSLRPLADEFQKRQRRLRKRPPGGVYDPDGPLQAQLLDLDLAQRPAIDLPLHAHLR